MQLRNFSGKERIFIDANIFIYNALDDPNYAQASLEILTVDAVLVEKSIDLGRRYGLLTADAIHLSTVEQYGIRNIATNDSDFERVESINIYKPERSIT